MSVQCTAKSANRRRLALGECFRYGKSLFIGAGLLVALACVGNRPANADSAVSANIVPWTSGSNAGHFECIASGYFDTDGPGVWNSGGGWWIWEIDIDGSDVLDSGELDVAAYTRVWFDIDQMGPPDYTLSGTHTCGFDGFYYGNQSNQSLWNASDVATFP